MNPITLRIAVTLDADAAVALVDLFALAVEKGFARNTNSAGRLTPGQEASRHALFAGAKPPEDQGLLVDTRQACKLLKVSSRTLFSIYSSGRMPAPIRIGRIVRWSYDELRAWVNSGSPPQSKWEWQKKEKT